MYDVKIMFFLKLNTGFRDGVRQLAALDIVFKGGPSSGGSGSGSPPRKIVEILVCCR